MIAPDDRDEDELDVRPCPSCPDGNEWNRNGPSGRACQTCKGYAAVKMNGEAFTAQEWKARREA